MNRTKKNPFAVVPGKYSSTNPRPYRRGLPHNDGRRYHQITKSMYSDNGDFFKKVERQAYEAGISKGVRDEKILLRATTLELIHRYNRGEATQGYDGKGNPIPVSDVAKVTMICKLAKVISELEKTDWQISGDNVISLDNFKIWINALAQGIKREFPTKEDQERFVKVSKEVGNPKIA